jgi:hypothetical protein
MSIAGISSGLPLSKATGAQMSKKATKAEKISGQKGKSFEQSLVEQDGGLPPDSSSKGAGPLRAAPKSAAPKSAAPAGVEKPSLLRRGMESVIKDEARVHQQLTRALRGRVDNLSDLLKIQVSVYRYSHQVDLMSKAVDKANQAVKQTLQTRV